jgi:hypothetical protein
MNVTEKPAQVCAQTDSLAQVKQRFERWRVAGGGNPRLFGDEKRLSAWQ